MSKTRQDKRSKVKPFIKVVNYNHLMPTRYTLELEGLKGVVTNDTFKEVSQREDAKKTVKKALEERYVSGKNRWFFTPLREYRCEQWQKCGLINAYRILNDQQSDGRVIGVASKEHDVGRHIDIEHIASVKEMSQNLQAFSLVHLLSCAMHLPT